MTGSAEQRARAPREIVVGVDGSEAAHAAVQYAIEVGRSLGAPVRLVHAVPVLGPAPPLQAVGTDLAYAIGRNLLANLARRAELAAPAVEVRTTLRLGPAAPALVAAADHAQLVVLGRRAQPGRLHLLGGSTAAAVAGRAHCPVRVVPQTWRSRPASRDVLVGVKDPATSAALLTRGLALAEAAGGTLVLLHAWRVPAGYQDLVAPPDAALWTAAADAYVHEHLATVRPGFPEVPVQVSVVQGAPVAALADASEQAGIVLVGRHHTGPFEHLGSVARGLLRTAACPVEIGLPAIPAGVELDLALERDGELLR